MEMKCPECRTLLEQQVMGGKRLWRCRTCSGIAISVPVVRAELEPEVFQAFWLPVAQGTGRPGRACASCGNAMAEVDAPSTRGTSVAIDVCRICQIDRVRYGHGFGRRGVADVLLGFLFGR